VNNLTKSAIVALLSLIVAVALIIILNAFIIGPDYITGFYNWEVLQVTIDKWHYDEHYGPKA
jgi:uncharacterized membrane protein